MNDSTKATTTAIAAAARRIVEVGRDEYDVLPRPMQTAQRTVWRAQLMSETGCSRQTAHRHIQRAIKRQTPPKWGRPKAGQPAKEQG